MLNPTWNAIALELADATKRPLSPPDDTGPVGCTRLASEPAVLSTDDHTSGGYTLIC